MSASTTDSAMPLEPMPSAGKRAGTRAGKDAGKPSAQPDIIRPYGDTTGDGMVQVSFTLPVAHD